MQWWVIELITNIVLVALAIGLGPFIKRFGRSYAADVFRANPRTGKSYLVLTDVAYYLIFVVCAVHCHVRRAAEMGAIDGCAARARDHPNWRDPVDHGGTARCQRGCPSDHRAAAVE